MNQRFLTRKNFCHFLCSAWFQDSIFITVPQLLIFAHTKHPSATLGNLTRNEQMKKQVQRHCRLQSQEGESHQNQGLRMLASMDRHGDIHGATCIFPPSARTVGRMFMGSSIAAIKRMSTTSEIWRL